MAQKEAAMNIAMVSVFVENPVEAFTYYTQVLGFEEVMYVPESSIAIVKSGLDEKGTFLLLEPVGNGETEISKVALAYKQKLYVLQVPVITFGCSDISTTFEVLQQKGVVFKKEPTQTDYGYEAVFDDGNGNFIQLIQMN